MRRGLWMLVKGASALQTQCDTGIPATSLKRNFYKCLGFHYSAHMKIHSQRWSTLESKIAQYTLQSWGGSFTHLLKDEEELIVSACEFAAQSCFPWSPFETTRLAWTMMQKLRPGCPSPGRGWLRGFEKRWAHRLQKCKTSSIDPCRARAASKKVRDEVFDKYVEFRQTLIDQGELTSEQLEHEENYILNIDEVGGDEIGKRIRCYQSARANQSIVQWRNIEVGGDHNPFHCTSLFGTSPNGKLLDWFTLIHSTPGCKNKRVRRDY